MTVTPPPPEVIWLFASEMNTPISTPPVVTPPVPCTTTVPLPEADDLSASLNIDSVIVRTGPAAAPLTVDRNRSAERCNARPGPRYKNTQVGITRCGAAESLDGNRSRSAGFDLSAGTDVNAIIARARCGASATSL